MIKTGRVCIIFGGDCNLQCKYCMRNLTTDLSIPPSLSDDFRSFLMNTDPSWCKAVVANGGEPLMYIDKVKEVFSLVPASVHKKIITNGTLLTQEIVDYINENDIELSVSHDGKMTEYLRGVDILKIPEILSLLKQVKDLTVVSVITNLNCSKLENYEYINNYLNRDNLFYLNSVYFDNNTDIDFISNFDYDKYHISLINFSMKYRYQHQHYSFRKSLGLNYLLDGSIVSMSTINRYGNIHNTISEIESEVMKDSQYCTSNKKCLIRDRCILVPQISSEHRCKIEEIHMLVNNYVGALIKGGL